MDAKLNYIGQAEAIFADAQVSKSLFEAIPVPAMLIHQDRIVIAANRAALAFGVRVGSHCWEAYAKLATIPDEDRAYFEQHQKGPECGTMCVFCAADHALSGDEPISKYVELGEQTWDAHWVPVADKVYLHFAFEVTAKKKIDLAG